MQDLAQMLAEGDKRLDLRYVDSLRVNRYWVRLHRWLGCPQKSGGECRRYEQ
ncbi:hypothetical protein Plhal304r1_c035g0109001 [Plasmopara halstedii]